MPNSAARSDHIGVIALAIRGGCTGVGSGNPIGKAHEVDLGSPLAVARLQEHEQQ